MIKLIIIVLAMMGAFGIGIAFLHLTGYNVFIMPVCVLLLGWKLF